MKPIDKIRRAVARLVLTITLPTIMYVLYNLGDPDYIPAPGWVIGGFLMLLATLWSAQYSEITYKRARD